jgi:hypothetical protein
MQFSLLLKGRFCAAGSGGINSAPSGGLRDNFGQRHPIQIPLIFKWSMKLVC